MAYSKEKQKQCREVADSSRESRAKDRGPRTRTSGLTSGLMDRPAAIPLLQRILSGRVRSSPLGGSRRSPRDRAGAPSRAAGEEGRGRRPPGAGRRLPGPNFGQRQAARGATPPTLGPRLGSQGQASPSPALQPLMCTAQPQPRHHPQPRGGSPTSCSLPAFPSGVQCVHFPQSRSA